MKISIKDLLKAADAIRAIKVVPLSVKIDLAKLLRSVSVETEIAATERAGVFRKYGKQDGDQIVVPSEKMLDFKAEIDKLMDLSVEVVPFAVSSTALDHLSAGEIEAILPLIEEKI